MTESSHWLLASKLIDLKVKNLPGENLGKIQELMCDVDTMSIAYCVLHFSSLLSLSSKYFMVPYHSFEFNTSLGVLNIDKARLKEAPGFDSQHWPNLDDPVWSESVYAFFGAKPHQDPR